MSQNWDELGLRENNNRTLSLLSLFWPMARTLLLCPGQPSCCSLAKWANICNVLHHYHIPCVPEGVLHINMSHGLEANPTIIRSALQLWARRRLIQALFERLAALETDGACSARSIPGKASSLAGKSWRFCACFYHVSHVCRQVGWDEINLL